MLEKEQLLAFFEKASSKYNECSFARCLEGKTPEEVEEIISNVQKEVFSEMNIDEELGFESLGQISEAFEDDYSFMRRFYKFVMEEADIGDKVVMSSEEYSKKCERVEQFTKATENKIAASTNLDSKEEDTLYIDLYRMIIAIAGDSEEYESDGNEHENEDEHAMSMTMTMTMTMNTIMNMRTSTNVNMNNSMKKIVTPAPAENAVKLVMNLENTKMRKPITRMKSNTTTKVRYNFIIRN
eukprot:CAMPEP_0175052956 /NCGR_PEP_ID=MMETSP0052_2-20121109/8649_1 /TAXON_ID=51329 ORGANISM="Polytomella parva, Strain SAG 63-3" /NCGR_SAMPLE_ID=MMETSP0052_2 /ASSEMBLY_ACC=CAM_ASM_000194 /LENGTH=239 /DNA_ID=CAMNT_0016317421 /DNA_START=589 /DNA_END=1306 /DNA_ORIENTATION=-